MNNSESFEILKKNLKKISTNETAMKYGLDKNVKRTLEELIGEKIDTPTEEEIQQNKRVFKMKDCSGWIFKKHDYEEWEMISQGDIARTSFFNNTEYTAGFWIKQQRICKNCGYIQTKIDKVMG